jgi:hypothetical protein
MEPSQDTPEVSPRSSELQRLERKVELLRQSIVLIAQVVQQLRDMTVREVAGR